MSAPGLVAIFRKLAELIALSRTMTEACAGLKLVLQRIGTQHPPAANCFFETPEGGLNNFRGKPGPLELTCSLHVRGPAKDCKN